MIKISCLLLVVLLLLSCSTKIDYDIESFNYEYSQISLKDTVVTDRNEIQLKISVDDTIFLCKKYFLSDNSSSSKIEDSIEIKYTVDNHYQIKKILNWREFYTGIENIYTNYIKQVSEETEADSIYHRYKPILDSSLVLNKNTQEARMFNVGYHYLNNRNTFDSTEYEIESFNTYAILTRKFNLDLTNDVTSKLRSVVDIKEMDNLFDGRKYIHIKQQIILDKNSGSILRFCQKENYINRGLIQYSRIKSLIDKDLYFEHSYNLREWIEEF